MFRALRIAGSLAIVLVAYSAYALLAVPWIEPTAEVTRQGDITDEERARGKQPANRRLSVWKDHFPAGAWELGTPKILESDQLTLLMQDYRNVGDGRLDDVTNLSRAGLGTRSPVTWGNGFADFDNDGDRDLFIACGHLYDKLEHFDRTTTYLTPNMLLENVGPGPVGVQVAQVGQRPVHPDGRGEEAVDRLGELHALEERHVDARDVPPGGSHFGRTGQLADVHAGHVRQHALVGLELGPGAVGLVQGRTPRLLHVPQRDLQLLLLELQHGQVSLEAGQRVAVALQFRPR